MHDFKKKKLIFPIELYELYKQGRILLKRDKLFSNVTEKEYLILKIHNIHKELRVQLEDDDGEFLELAGISFRDMKFETTERLGVHVVPFDD